MSILLSASPVLSVFAQTTSFPTGITIETEETRYTRGETVGVIGQIHGLAGPADLMLLSIYGPDSSPFQVTKTSVVNGLFKYSFSLTNAQYGTWTIVADYGGIDESTTFVVVENEMFANLILNPPALTDRGGNDVPPENRTAGKEYAIRTEVVSDELDISQEFVLIVQVVDSEGFSNMITLRRGTVAAGQNLDTIAIWQPERDGTFHVESFIWSDVGSPVALDDKQARTFVIL